MRKEFLEDYQARENAALQRYADRVRNGSVDIDERFPSLDRFNKINYPIVVCDRTTYVLDGEKIWSQVPFAGTLVIPLHNLTKENMLNGNGFDVNDIPYLISLAKSSGKVQFALTARAQLYEGLEHLEPIFTELKPPLLAAVPHDALVDSTTYKKWLTEFSTLSNVAYTELIAEQVLEVGQGRALFENIMTQQAHIYVALKILKLDYLAEKVANSLIDSPEFANLLLGSLSNITSQVLQGLHANVNIGMTKVKMHGLDAFPSLTELPKPLMPLNKDFTYPVEIGRFLLKKIALRPASYEACISIMDHYKQNDLYKAMESLDKGVRYRSVDKIVQNVGQLDTILDNIWQDSSRLGKQKLGLASGIDVCIGVAGEL